MKKLTLAFATVALIVLGPSVVNAQQPDPNPVVPVPENSLVECGESDGRVDNDGDGIADDCVEFYVEALPPTTTAPATTTTQVASSPPGGLPKTGGTVSPMLGMGALLLVGGGIIVVATRRRSHGAPAT